MLYDTELAYLKDAYLKELDTEIVEVAEEAGGHLVIYLDTTIFYPEGGGQPSDVGKIIGENGTATVVHAKYSQGVVMHQCQIEGTLAPEDAVKCRIDWDARYRNMRVHTAGHLVHDALMQLITGVVPSKGHHGNKPFLEYSGEIASTISVQLENLANKMAADKLDTYTKMVDLSELQRLSRFVPPHLPKDKPLRIFWIHGCDPMPDGGTQVNNTGEIGQVKIVSISTSKGISRVRYEIVDTKE